MPGIAVNVREVSRPTADELKQMSEILYEAFKDVDPITKFVTGDDSSLIHEFHYATMAACAIGGRIFVAELVHNPGIIVGCVAFYPPGRDVLADDEQISQGFGAFLEKLPPDIVDWWMGFMPKFAAMSDEILGKGTKEAAWKMNCLGVAVLYRRHHIGTALVQAGESLAKADKKSMIFEGGSEGTELYQRMGYTLVGTQSIGGAEAGDSKVDMEKLTLNVFRKTFE